MTDEIDSFPCDHEKKETVNEEETESDDEKYSPCAISRKENNIESNDRRTNDSHGKTDKRLVHAHDITQQDPGILPCYYYREPFRGSAIFVVNQTFPSDYRKGAEMDLLYLKFVFLDKFGFEQLNKGDDFDLDKTRFDDVLEKATSKDYSDTDFFVFAISTHGEERPRLPEHFEHALICSDGQYKFTKDIIDSFNRCSTLAGKPKIFVIQACRNPSGSNENGSQNVDLGIEFKFTHKREDRCSETKVNDKIDDKAESNNEVKARAGAKNVANENAEAKTKADEKDKTKAQDDTDAKLFEKGQAGTEHKSKDYLKGQSYLGSGKTHLTHQKDCLVVYAIQSGKMALRNEQTGSWLLYDLNETIKEYTYPCQIDFLEILTTTAFKMAQRETSEIDTLSAGLKAVPVIQHALTKDLLIPIRNRQA